MGLFTKPSPIDKFNASYLQLKALAYKMMMGHQELVEKKIGAPRPDDFGVFASQCVDYLLGEDITAPGPTVSAAKAKAYRKMVKKTPARAAKVRKIPVLNAFFAAVLDYKDDTLSELLGSGWTDTPEGKRVDAIIRDTPATIEDAADYQQFRQMIGKL